MAPSERITQHSTYIERLLEHRFLAELLTEAWRHGQVLDVVRPEVDANGCDLMLGHGGRFRPVQLKSRIWEGKTDGYSIRRKLADYPGACVVVLYYDAETLELRSAGFFAATDPTAPMPSLDNRPNATDPLSGREKPQSCWLKDSACVEMDVPNLLASLFPSFAAAVASAGAAKTREAEFILRVDAGRFEVQCGDSHSLWAAHQDTSMRRRTFEALVAIVRSRGDVPARISVNGNVIVPLTKLWVVNDQQLSWEGGGLDRKSGEPLTTVVIELQR